MSGLSITAIWLQLASEMPHTRLIDVCDREADFFELFDEQRQNPCVDLLVRAKHNRNITEEPFKLFAAVRQAPVQSRVRVHIPRQSARPKRSKQKARPKRPGRTADMAVRYMRIQLRPAHYHADKEPIDIWVIHALEENPPPNSQGCRMVPADNDRHHLGRRRRSSACAGTACAGASKTGIGC